MISVQNVLFQDIVIVSAFLLKINMFFYSFFTISLYISFNLFFNSFSIFFSSHYLLNEFLHYKKFPQTSD